MQKKPHSLKLFPCLVAGCGREEWVDEKVTELICSYCVQRLINHIRKKEEETKKCTRR